MAAYFFDSSALVKRYARETGTSWMLSLFRRPTLNTLYAARITRVEVMAALARKQRGTYLTHPAQVKAESRVRRDFGSLRIYTVEITPAVLLHAEALAPKHYLRGYDAVQLAAALEADDERSRMGLSSLTMVTADKGLIQAAPLEGLTVDNPELH
ncbi:MAG: type II toxin-antitoxin system VapC family toxin [Pyrinomonadaceae bacterium MAG19_C2-C3]|nr:type II toxin-antitoxin system VapC family toxin [Pyrinomonadaceae bacterium MAG19_C2-C3]